MNSAQYVRMFALFPSFDIKRIMALLSEFSFMLVAHINRLSICVLCKNPNGLPQNANFYVRPHADLVQRLNHIYVHFAYNKIPSAHHSNSCIESRVPFMPFSYIVVDQVFVSFTNVFCEQAKTHALTTISCEVFCVILEVKPKNRFCTFRIAT